MQRVVFDAYAIIAWLQGEPGKEFVERLITRVLQGDLWGGICVVNLGEVYYNIVRKHGEATAIDCLRLLRGLEWEMIPAENDVVWAAARLKAQYPISYADAFALACAIQHQADLVTDDPELRLADHGVKVRWQPE